MHCSFISRFFMRELMFPRLEVIDEFVHAREAPAWDSTRAATEMAEVTRRLVVAVLDVTLKKVVGLVRSRTASSWAENT